jgi:putative transposase
VRAPDPVKRNFPAARISSKWYGDGTEIAAGQGKLHLASVLTMGTRRVLGFALREHHDVQLTYGALAMAVAVAVRGGQVSGVILHTNQGRIHRLGVASGLCGCRSGSRWAGPGRPWITR